MASMMQNSNFSASTRPQLSRRTIKELAYITTTAGRRAVNTAYVERTTRIHRRNTRRVLRVQDSIDIQTERSPIPCSRVMSELADRYFAGVRSLIKREMTDSELEGNEHPCASWPCEQQSLSIALAEDDILVYWVAHLRQRLDPGFYRVVAIGHAWSIRNLDALIAAIKTEGLAHHTRRTGRPI